MYGAVIAAYIELLCRHTSVCACVCVHGCMCVCMCVCTHSRNKCHEVDWKLRACCDVLETQDSTESQSHGVMECGLARHCL